MSEEFSADFGDLFRDRVIYAREDRFRAAHGIAGDKEFCAVFSADTFYFLSNVFSASNGYINI